MKLMPALLPTALVLALAGCMSTLPGAMPDDRAPLTMPELDEYQEVWALTTVIDDGSGPQLCPLVLESFPPQCGSPIPIDEWSWDRLEHDENGPVRWGFFAVYGTYDGERFTVTQDPEFGGAIDVAPLPATGPLTADEVATAAREIQEDLLGDYTVGEGDGYVILDVVWDDGTLQRQLEERYGEGAVVVNSYFRLYDRA